MDVSGHQTPERVKLLVADPKNEFVIVKATQGLAYVSSGWSGHRDLAGAKYLGSYHYGEPPHPALQEMDHYLAVTEGKGLLAIDVEYFGRGRRVSKEDPLSPAEEVQLATYVLDGARYLREKAGRKALTYTNWLWLPFIRNGCTVAQWDELVDLSPLWLAEIAAPGKHSIVDPKPGSTKNWPVWLHQYAYTADSTGAQVDRDWTPDLNVLKGQVDA